MSPPTKPSRWMATGLLTLGIFVAWHAAIVAGLIPPGDGYGTWADNYIRAERFAYREIPPEPYLLLVGSSLTVHLRTDYFSGHAVNLAMNAGCSATGLELIARTDWPRRAIVLVEVNATLRRGVDRALLHKLFAQPWYEVRRFLPFLREEYRPITVLLKALRDQRLSRLSIEQRDGRENIDFKLRKRFLDEMVLAGSRGFGRDQEVLLEAAADKLEEQVLALRRRGLRVVLFRTPIDAAFEASLTHRQDREFFERRFPPARFEWIPECRDVATWDTTDGEHLTKRHARVFARHLESRAGP